MNNMCILFGFTHIYVRKLICNYIRIANGCICYIVLQQRKAVIQYDVLTDNNVTYLNCEKCSYLIKRNRMNSSSSFSLASYSSASYQITVFNLCHLDVSVLILGCLRLDVNLVATECNPH